VAETTKRQTTKRQTTKRTAMAAKRAAGSDRGDGGAERPSPEELAASGKAARAKAPLEAQADFQPAVSRDPVGLLIGQAKTRVPELVPIRYGRMLVSPFAFYRGAALVMAADLSTTPTAGLRAQLCGDAHVANFGAYASPERRLVFDVNDLDETLSGPFEWDVKRLAASLVVAGRENGFTRKQCRKASLAAVASYRNAMRAFATQPILAVWYAHVDVDDAVTEFTSSLSARKRKKDKAGLKATRRWVEKAHTRDTLEAIDKWTTVNGARRIISDPPLIVPIHELTELDQDGLLGRISDLLATYRGTLQYDRRDLIDHFTLADVAHKVVGVGSVGLRAWILLLEAGEAEALFLQAKQAERSALADYVGEPDHANQGERVVTGQRLMQASSDIFLGWLRARPTGDEDQDYYMRQLRDWKMSADMEEMRPRRMRAYGELCGWTLAHAHARSGDRVAIAAYLGKSAKFDNALAYFAEAYADQNERDYAALAAAADAGRIQVRTGM
jgi:uncharacterized protein (DUF2252 family)